MSDMFRGATEFNGDITDWNTESVTDISGMFLNAANFNQDLSEKTVKFGTPDEYRAWVLSSVTDMNSVFLNAEDFDHDISDWSTENVQSMINMFRGASSFNQDIGSWDTGEVTSMITMFLDATVFDQDLGDWDIADVTSFSGESGGMFSNTNLSTANYDSLLIGWAAQTVQSGINFDATGLSYCEGADARQDLIDPPNNWTITGDAFAGGCVLPRVVSASNSEVTATTPHTADGVDESTVTVVLRDEDDDPISGFFDGDFLVELTGSASASAVNETGTSGTYSFTVTDAVEEVITVTVTVDGTELDDEPTIDFEAPPQVVSASNSEVTATTPHTADGVDQSTVTVVLRDEEDDPISGFADGDFLVEVSGSASASEITETGTAGTYSFTVINAIEEIVTVTVTADGTELDDEPTIDFEAPPQVVSASNSEVTATTPHAADGVDESTVTVVLRDEEDDPISGFTDSDFSISLTGSASASAVSETGTPGTYSFTVTDTVDEIVTVTVTADGTELDDEPTIDFEAPPQVVSASNSELTATTPHTADGVDQSTVTVVLRDEEDDPISGFTSANFTIEVTGSASDSEISETGTPGTYSFAVTNTVAELVTVTVTASGVELDDKPIIDFQAPPQVVSASNSEVTATTPHTADGVDQSTVTVILRDEEDDPVSGFDSTDFLIELTGSAAASEISETGRPGTYSFTVTDAVEEIVTVTVTADGTELDHKPTIDFEAPVQVVDATDSEVTATTPHIADGVDASTVTVVLKDDTGDPISGFTNADFLIELTGSGFASEVTESGTPGTYTFTVSDDVAEIVTVTITTAGKELDDNPEIEFQAPIQIVDAENSKVSATTPHTADGVDQSTVTVQLRDEEDDPITGFSADDFSIELTGSASASEITETETSGTYSFTVTDTKEEVVIVSVKADGIELDDQPEIDFLAPVQVVDSEGSEVSATSPHIADGVDASEVSITLLDVDGKVITGLTNDDFKISLKGMATPGKVIESQKPGVYIFSLRSKEAGAVTIGIKAKEVELEDQPEVVFEKPEIVVSPTFSELTATTPHIANGEDESTVIITLRDIDNELITGFLSTDFSIELIGNAEASDVMESDQPGAYTFTVISKEEGIVTVSVSVKGVELDEKAKIQFEEPEQIVDAFNSELSASTPHLADGEDASTVSITLRDDVDELISGRNSEEFEVDVTGSANVGEITETDPGIYQLSVTNEVVEIVTVTVTVSGVELSDQVKIVFEKVPDPVPKPPEIIALDGGETGIQIQWQMEETNFIDRFLIYKGSTANDLNQFADVSVGTFQFTDSNLNNSTVFYAVSAVNTDGVEGGLSDVVAFFNSSIVAENSQWKLVSNSLDESIPNNENTTLFSFSNQYQQATELNPSRGYWIKSKTFDSEELSLVGSGLINTTIQLREGWNLIGSLSAPINVEDIVDESGILTSAPIFRFNGNSYESVEILNPNDGHWIFAENDGSIELNVEIAEEDQSNQIATKNKELEVDNSKIWIEFEGENEVQKLSISEDPLSYDEVIPYKLPPVAPSGIFDVRTDRNLSILNGESNRIRIQSDYYPVTVRVQGSDANQESAWRFIMQSKDEEKTVDLLPGQPFQIAKEYDRIEIIKVGMDEVITEHKLLPNFPNPFNPATTIQYQVLEQVHVQIEIFDVTGRRVQVLANEMQKTGIHQIRFDARHFSSGMYFVRFMAGNQHQIQKITLIK
jgi:surface protein